MTDENGEIRIEGLRVGEYVISEVLGEANARYVLPDDITLTVFADKTTVAKFYNKLKPVTPDIPKTGDSTNIGLWAALCAVSLAGIGATAFFGFRKKRKLKKARIKHGRKTMIGIGLVLFIVAGLVFLYIRNRRKK